MDLDTFFDRAAALWSTPVPGAPGENPVTLGQIGIGLLIAIVTILLARFLERRVARALARNAPERTGSAGATGRLVYYTLLVIGLTVALNSVGVQLSALFAAGAIFAVGLGFGLQNVVQNFVSGILLLGERVIKPGDVLELDGVMVRVEKMGLRSTVARTLDEDQFIVPNQELVQSRVKNYTLSDPLYRLRVQVGVSYHSDLPRVFEVLEAAGAELSTLKSHPARVLLLGFGASSIDFEVSVWIDDPWVKRRQTSDLALAIWKHLKAAGIEIAFPQLDLHLDEQLLDALRQRAPAPSAAPAAPATTAQTTDA